MSSSDNSFQDWKPMILNKSNSGSNSGSKSESQKSKTKVNISEEEARNRKIENGENFSKKINQVLKTAFQQKRIQMKLTQKQLAQQANLDIKVISEIETGKRDFNNSEILKCERVLGKLPRK